MEPGEELDALIAYSVMESPGDTRPYSTDTAASEEVLEKLRADSDVVITSSYKDGGWVVSILDQDGVELQGDFSESRPHAICLAALKVVKTEPAQPDADE